mmetsp:Transcript_13197/g.9553  ORF Transcript_13197/g.9553 Transcript_13197/m.9553 type:complete len:176 (+) Transcript_13197:67-594(+)
MCAYLGLGRILYLLPQDEFVNNLLQTVLYTLQTAQNPMLLQASVKCIYYSVKYSKVHTQYLLQNKLMAILQQFIDKAIDEKLCLYSLLVMKELAVNGFAMQFMDNLLFNQLMRIILQGNENPMFEVAIDIIKAVAETSSYNVINLASYGLIRSLCYGLEQFRVYKDSAIELIFQI